MSKITLPLLTLFTCCWMSITIQAQNTHKIMVPAYFFPNDNNDPGTHNVGPNWSTLIEAAKLYKDRLVIIANPDNGPGSGSGEAWKWGLQKYTEAITKVRAEGAIVLGYVYTCYGMTTASTACQGRTLEHLKTDIANWKAWYPVDGIFLDECSTSLDTFTWYKNLDTYIQGVLPGALIVSNFGTPPAKKFYNRIGAPVIMENTGLFLDGNRTLLNTPPLNSVALIHSANIAEWKKSRTILMNKGVQYFYVTNDGGDNPWDTLPDFFMQLF